MKPRRSAPARPYRKYPIRRLLLECNRRLAGARGPRAWLALAALIHRSPQVGSGVVFLGDSCVDAGREHCCGSCRRNGKSSCEHAFCCMARLMSRCGKTAHRAKYDLERAGIIRLHGAGAGVRGGGKMLDGTGRAVGAATGYELDPELFTTPAPADQQASTSTSPAQRRVAAEGMQKAREALERMRARSAARAPDG